MSQIYAICDWVIEPEHIREFRLDKFMDVATDLNCKLWIDWQAVFTGKLTRRFLIQAPSPDAVKQLIERAGAEIGLKTWVEKPFEYFASITKNGEVPSLQVMREQDGHKFGKLRENFLAMTYLSKQ